MIIKNPQGVVPEDIISSTWEISDKMNFSNIVLKSVEDKVNKLGILFREDLDPNVKWYGRCRVLLRTGWTTYGNLDVVPVNLQGYMQQNEDMPSRVSTPIIKTSATDYGKHDSCLFTINLSGYGVMGTARLIASNYAIVDISTNEVVWCKLGMEIEKEAILVEDIILEDNKVYRIMANFISSSNDHSQVATKTIVIGNPDLQILTPVDLLRPEEDNLLIVSDPSVDTMEYTYEIVLGLESKLVSVYKEKGSEKHLLPANTLKPGNIYILRIANSLNIFHNEIITTF